MKPIDRTIIADIIRAVESERDDLEHVRHRMQVVYDRSPKAYRRTQRGQRLSYELAGLAHSIQFLESAVLALRSLI